MTKKSRNGSTPRKRLKRARGASENSVCPYCGEPMPSPPMEFIFGDRCESCGGWCAVALIDGLWTWAEYPLDMGVYLDMWEDDDEEQR